MGRVASSPDTGPLAYKPGDADSTQGVQRITPADEDHNARLAISDVHGHPRIRIGVDAAGTPTMTMVGENGKAIYRAGQQREERRLSLPAPKMTSGW
jgi:hypothetical protein